MAVDDAYSRYVMTLSPRWYFRFRDLAVGNFVYRSETKSGFSSEYGVRCAGTTLTAAHIGTGSLLPGLSNATFLQLRSNFSLRIHRANWYASAVSTSYNEESLTNDWMTFSQGMPCPAALSVNYWYRNTTNDGNINKRLLSIQGAESDNGGSSNGGVTGLHTFAWNWSDNMLVEALFKRRNHLLGTAVLTNPGNNEMWRYLSVNGASIPVNTVTMFTLVLTKDSMSLYKNGVLQRTFTWNHKHYAPLRYLYFGMVFGAGSSNSGYTLYDYANNVDAAELSIHSKSLTAAEVLELYTLGTTGQHSRSVTGYVRDPLGVGISRLVRAHKQTNGAVLGETTSAADGSFTLRTPGSYTGRMYLLAFDDLNASPDYNAAILSDVVPRT